MTNPHPQPARVRLRPLSLNDAPFILDLVNAEGWLRFIGDRNVHSLGEATRYIEGILSKASVQYAVIEAIDTGKAIGVVTLLQRSYLSFPDLGFALLPGAQGKGFAFEGARQFMEEWLQKEPYRTLGAITLPENERSIKLLSRLGFQYAHTVQEQDVTVSVYIYRK